MAGAGVLSVEPFANWTRANEITSMGRSESETIGASFDMLRSPTMDHQEPKDLSEYKPTLPSQAQDDGNPLVVKLEIRRGRLAILTVLAVGVIVALMAVFSHGVELWTFDASTKSAEEQTKLTDDYNSYSGHITSGFTTPLEVFVSNSVQIVVLHFMVSSVLSGEPTMVEYGVTLAFGTGVAYLINNGFDAVNVQLRDLPVVPRMVNDDVFQANYFVDSDEGGITSSTYYTYPETQAKNPITNTILRNLATQRYQKESSMCNWTESAKRFHTSVRDEASEIAIPAADWHGLFLQHAIGPKNLTIIANATDPNANAGVKSENLPMDVSVAANLLTHALYLPVQYNLPWGAFDTDFYERMENNKYYPAAELIGFLPWSNASGTTAASKLDFFIKESPKVVAKHFSKFSQKTSLSDISLTFSHVDVSPLVAFDSVTIEVEVEHSLLTNVTLNNTRYTVLGDNENFAPWMNYTIIKKAFYSNDENQYDVPPQIHAMRFCLNDAGTEDVQLKLVPNTDQNLPIQCSKPSTNSLLLVSVSKRLVADELIQNRTANASGIFVDESQPVAVVTNLRKYVSFTVGRLSWKFTDLAKDFNAECVADEDIKCTGFSFPLGRAIGAKKDDKVAQQHLLLSSSWLQLDVLTTPSMMMYAAPRSLPLVQVYEPLRPLTEDQLYDISAGDPLLPHNIGKITWYTPDWGLVTTTNLDTCSSYTEDRVAKHINNHMYIESPVQPTYTAGLFFLLQMAVVRDTINVTATVQSLNFDYNLHTKSVFVSIPNRNAWFTIGGCILLALGLAAVGTQTATKAQSKKRAELDHITDPHTIARVMLDEEQFPPMLLRRRVVDPVEGDNALKMDTFAIHALSLKREDFEAARSALV